MDKDWVTRHSGTIGHSVPRRSVDLALGPLGTGSNGHWGARHSVAPSPHALGPSWGSDIFHFEVFFIY